jgi:hypothetical protein
MTYPDDDDDDRSNNTTMKLMKEELPIGIKFTYLSRLLYRTINIRRKISSRFDGLRMDCKLKLYEIAQGNICNLYHTGKNMILLTSNVRVVKSSGYFWLYI